MKNFVLVTENGKMPKIDSFTSKNLEFTSSLDETYIFESIYDNVSFKIGYYSALYKCKFEAFYF
jgi:hypothetical protein